MKKLLMTAATLVALATPAAAGGTLTSSILAKYCSRANSTCYGYILAIAETVRPCGMTEALGRDGVIKADEMRFAVLRYLNGNPQRLNLPPNQLVVEAFNAAWPCKEKQKQQAAEKAFQEWKAQQEETVASSRTQEPNDDLLFAAPAQAAAPMTPVDFVALMAEHMTSCGSRLTPVIERDAIRIVERIGYKKWYELASWVHLERDEAATDKFCSNVSRVLNKSLAGIDLRPESERPPIPAELDLSELNRRIAGPPWCRLPHAGLVASANREACQ
jgi:hypothetical protein